MPGHLGWVLSRHPELRLPSADDPDALVRGENALDITRDEVLGFARALVDDMIGHFPFSTRWNLGGDEFVDFARMDAHPALALAAASRYGADATGFDLLTGFVNEMAAHLRRRGFTTRVWNDGMLRGSRVRLDGAVELTWWTNWHAQMRPLRDAVDAGHSIVNVSDAMFYYVLGEKTGYRYRPRTGSGKPTGIRACSPRFPAGNGRRSRRRTRLRCMDARSRSGRTTPTRRRRSRSPPECAPRCTRWLNAAGTAARASRSTTSRGSSVRSRRRLPGLRPNRIF
ncbi:family 20 glycosylhydrolase [Microbacterium sp. NPDC089318]